MVNRTSRAASGLLAPRAVAALRKLVEGTTARAPAPIVRARLVKLVLQLVVALVLEQRRMLDGLAHEGAPAVRPSHLPELLGRESLRAGVDTLLLLLHRGWQQAGVAPVHAVPGGLFSPQQAADEIEIGDASLAAALDELGASGDLALSAEMPVEEIGAAYEALTEWDVARADALSLLPRDGSELLELERVVARSGQERIELVASALGRTLPPRAASACRNAPSVAELVAVLRRYACPHTPCPIHPGSWVVIASQLRRRRGSHYTSRELADRVVADTLRPLLDDASRLPRVCDPSMGTGAFLLAAGRLLVELQVASAGPGARSEAWQRVLEGSLYGVDTDELAVCVARACLAIEASGPGAVLPDAPGLRCGDALVGLAGFDPRGDADAPFPAGAATAGAPWADALIAAYFSTDARKDRASRVQLVVDVAPAPVDAGAWPEPIRGWLERLRTTHGTCPFHWSQEFPQVASAGGFDAMVGNPPWVAYAGRAAQPLERARFDWYRQAFASFRGYRTLHGLFIERCARLLRPGGRLGLIVPTSVVDLGGYEPVRRAHDAWCRIDPELPDLGSDAFPGVFQPAVAVLSTRHSGGASGATAAGTWSVARRDIDPATQRLVARMERWPTVSADTFAERGYQSSRQDAGRFVAAAARGKGLVPIREGADIGPFVAFPPRWFADPAMLSGRLRSAAQWSEVALLVRQTARYPIAAMADGTAFRNSILAGFERAPWSRFSLLAYLNSWPVRWLHYTRFRDARQGMPQVKVAHLRATPALQEARFLESLDRLGKDLWRRQVGIEPADQAVLDRIVADAWGLADHEARIVSEFAARWPVPARAHAGSPASTASTPR